MPATTLTAIAPFEMILFGKTFVPFGSDVIVALFQLHSFLEVGHSTKIPNSYLVFMFVLVIPYLLPKKFTGMSLWPFVILKYRVQKEDKVFLNHERIHLRQQIELLVVPFYLIYVLEFMLRLLQYKNRNKAYRNISFEREAYQNEKDLEYLKTRPFWRVFRYLS